MVGWWKLDETGGTTANDSSGNDRKLVLAGTDGSTNWKVAKFNNGLEFDGTNDYAVNFGNQGILVPISALFPSGLRERLLVTMGWCYRMG